MAEITKITTPMMPKESTSIKHKPVTDQAFQLTEPGKVHKQENEGKLTDRQPDASTLLKESMGRAALLPLLKNSGEMMQAFKKIAMLVEMGVSASDATKDAATRELLESLFVSPKQVAGIVAEQDRSSVLFKGEAFDILRDIMAKFEDSPKVKDAVVNLLKAFEQNVNTKNSITSILNNCNQLLDYMFSKDRGQFSNYLKDLAQMLLPKDEAAKFIAKMPETPVPPQAQQAQQAPQAPNDAQAAQSQNPNDAQAAAKPDQAQNPAAQNANGQPTVTQGELPEQAKNAQQAGGANQAQEAQQGQKTEQQFDPLNRALNTEKFGQELHQTANKTADQQGTAQGAQELSQKEAAQVLKSNLLPLLGEIVVKYNQSDKIRDIVMNVVHNLVRVDKGTPEALNDAVNKLMNELKDVANVPKDFPKQFLESISQSITDAKEQPNSVISKLSDIVSEALRSPETNPAVLKQAESMLVSMLQNQSAIMDILHFVVPFQTALGQVFTELYVDPETEEHVGKQKGQSRKIFLSVESEAHGSFELSFLETGDHVDFNLWAPEDLVPALSGLKRNFADIMQLHGYTMNSFKVDEMKAPHTVAEVFPRLIEKKVGIDLNA